MKKFIFPLGTLLLFIFIAFGIQTLFKDDWICERGQWVNHGGLLAPEPIGSCIEMVEAEEQMLGTDKDEHGCIGSAGYTWCEQKQKCLRTWEEPCTGEEVFELLSDIKENVDFDFSGIANTDLDWKIATESAKTGYDLVLLEGKKITAIELTVDAPQEVIDYFVDHNFQRDTNNVSVGEFSNETAFTSSNIVCLVKSFLSDTHIDTTPIEEDVMLVDIEVKCGKL